MAKAISKNSSLILNHLYGKTLFFQKWLEHISYPNSLGSNPISMVFGKNIVLVIIGIFSNFYKVSINKNWFVLIPSLYEKPPILPYIFLCNASGGDKKYRQPPLHR
jgi:hypothetical protein